VKYRTFCEPTIARVVRMKKALAQLIGYKHQSKLTKLTDSN
jgi:hypothetical protein